MSAKNQWQKNLTPLREIADTPTNFTYDGVLWCTDGYTPALFNDIRRWVSVYCCTPNSRRHKLGEEMLLDCSVEVEVIRE